jgi:hypothetical protein
MGIEFFEKLIEMGSGLINVQDPEGQGFVAMEQRDRRAGGDTRQGPSVYKKWLLCYQFI